MAHARYDAVADFYIAGFGSADDPASLALLELLGPLTVISGALRPRGRFVFSVLHPCFAGGKDISGSWPPTGRYYDEGRWTADSPLSTLRRQVGSSHRMLSTYLNTLRRHGLWLDQVAEPLPVPGWDRAHDADRQPVFLVARTLKLAGD